MVAVLFPIFASYKALKTSDPAQLTPWLMYWVVYSCLMLAEYWVAFILTWFVAPARTPSAEKLLIFISSLGCHSMDTLDSFF